MAVAFSYASGIFHPYYVSLLAPFTAALVGARRRSCSAAGRSRASSHRWPSPSAWPSSSWSSTARGTWTGSLPVLVVVGAATAATLAIVSAPRIRAAAVALFLAAALVGPRDLVRADARPRDERHVPRGRPAPPARCGGPGGARRRPRPRRLPRRRAAAAPAAAPAAAGASAAAPAASAGGAAWRRRDVRRLVGPHRGPRLREGQRRRHRRRRQPAGRRRARSSGRTPTSPASAASRAARASRACPGSPRRSATATSAGC